MLIRLRSLLAFSIFAVLIARQLCAQQRTQVDILLKGGTIVDGAGGEPYEGSVAVRDGMIVNVGADIEVAAARQTVDCSGLVICPGFIDLHNHSDNTILSPETRDARCYLTQGCTTLVTGNCGGGQRDTGKFYDELAATGIGINIAHLVPHGAIRDQVMGKIRRAPTEKELQQMKELVAAGMREGAWGMSTGLLYVPSAFADIDELVALSQTIAEHGGIYASHIRNEDDELFEAVEEVIEIARRAGLPCHISHIKASDPANWGKLWVVARMIEEARGQGLKITADQYPYNASSTSMMAMLLPDKEREGGEAATAERLKKPDEAARLRSLVSEEIEDIGPLMIASFPAKPQWLGKTLHDVAKLENCEPVDVAFELFRDPKAQGINFGMGEEDVRFAMTLPWVATASDGSSKIDDGTRPHPRSYGTFPRKIGHYAIREKVLSMTAAIRSASGLPADILGMTNRGYVRENLVADLVVFDPKQFEDRATYEKPFETSVGIRCVLVNGKVAIADGVPQEVFAGRPLRRETSGGN
ncbi:MAG TPA: D-aminoacylase [Lacipirellulaceae bacterium]|jgi:N-acyl-D-aspartate/D-glutamate deacylase|nr:D-aminoacylase [Lacipirellulaceae bacterium]